MTFLEMTVDEKGVDLVTIISSMIVVKTTGDEMTLDIMTADLTTD